MIESELLHYGYLFILVGTVIEGDATLLTAAFLAHRGYFRLSWVMIAACLTTLLASHGYYEFARRTGSSWLEGHRTARLDRVVGWSRKRGGPLLVASRFMIGFRTLVPIVCGATGMSPSKFLIWNSIGAALWAVVFGAAGYLGGHALTIVLGDIRRHEKTIAVAMAVLVSGAILWRTHGRELLDAWSLRRSRLSRR